MAIVWATPKIFDNMLHDGLIDEPAGGQHGSDC